MPYYLDFSALDLNYLATRLSEEDLIPSQLPLREDLPEKLASFRNAGVGTLADL